MFERRRDEWIKEVDTHLQIICRRPLGISLARTICKNNWIQSIKSVWKTLSVTFPAGSEFLSQPQSTRIMTPEVECEEILLKRKKVSQGRTLNVHLSWQRDGRRIHLDPEKLALQLETRNLAFIPQECLVKDSRSDSVEWDKLELTAFCNRVGGHCRSNVELVIQSFDILNWTVTRDREKPKLMTFSSHY